MSTICITHLAVLCNYAPCSDTCCIVLHVNSIRVIRVPYEYTVNWQQIPLFNFQSFRNYRRNHNGFFLLFSLSFFLFPNDRARQIPKQLFLGHYLLNRKRRARKKKKDKSEKWSRRNLWLLPPGAVCTHLNLREIAGDTSSMRDQRGSLLCFAYLKHYQ